MSTDLILPSDIEIRASERMTDAGDGGGEMTGIIISSDAVHQVFGPISQSDRTVGRISLRGLYMHIDTQHDGTYYGANIIIDQKPTDPNVNIVIFAPSGSGIEHTEAKEYIESYNIIGPRSSMHPVGTQSAGQKQILVYQQTGQKLPQEGDVYFLSIESGEEAGTTQAFQVDSVESESAIYYESIGGELTPFTVVQISLGITQTLSYTFPGADPLKTRPGETWVRTSQISDSARYYGTAPIQIEAPIGAVSLECDSIFTKLLPATTSETPVLDTKLTTSLMTVNAGSHDVEVSNNSHSAGIEITSGSRGYNYIKTLQPLPASGSTIVSYMTQGRWYDLQDDGTGVLVGQDPAYGAGSVSYSTGTALVTLGALPDVGSQIIWQWGSESHYVVRTSAVPTLDMDYDFGEPVDPESLEISYTTASTPRTATTTVDGVITGYGMTGTIDAALGLLRMKWTTPPDAYSTITASYDAMTIVQEATPVGGATLGNYNFTLQQSPVAPGSLKLTWECYPWWGAASGFDIRTPGQTTATTDGLIYLAASDDGSGVITAGELGTIGSVNYTTGAMTINVTPTVLRNVYYSFRDSAAIPSAWYPRIVGHRRATPVSCKYKLPATGVTERTVNITPDGMRLTFGDANISDQLVPNSLRFQWNGQEYHDQEGLIYRQAIPWSDAVAGLYAGTIDYATRSVLLTDYTTGDGAVTVRSCLTRYGQWTAVDFFARAPGSPLRPASLYIRALTLDGRTIDATADTNGVIESDEIHGTVEQDMGIISVIFGQYVLDSSLSADEKSVYWYDPADILPDGTIWRPTPVYPDTVTINAIVLTNLPLDAAELGIDPVKLPSNGLVPIFKPGYRIVIHHTESMELPNPIVAGATYDCGRTRIARVRLTDAVGRVIPDDRMYQGQYQLYDTLSPEEQSAYYFWDIDEEGYVWVRSSMDLDAGLIEIADPLDLAGYTQPITLHHTIEDSAQAVSADLSGRIELNTAVTHTFPLGSLVSSQLFLGDLWARYTNLFSQATWTGAWSDSQIGSATTAQFNDALYPITITNAGAISERWRFVFTSTTAFTIIGERLGQIGVGSTVVDCGINNPATNVPYFSVDFRAFGSGWSVGNVIRFNTIGNNMFWMARTVSPGPATGNVDLVRVAVRGDSTPL